MRFTSTSILALPLVATAAQVETPLEQAKAQLKSWGSYLQNILPSPNAPHTPGEAAAKVGGKAVNVLTLNTWEQTIRSSYNPNADQASESEQWWILLTGGNRTCFGHCGTVEKAFNQTAALWSADPRAPNLAYLNCEYQPVLCNSWAAGPPTLWFLEQKPAPGKSDLRIIGLNTTTTSVQTFNDLRSSESWRERPLYEGAFHPLDGWIKQYGLATPLGYFFWIFAVVPNWLFMIVISFASRYFM